MNITTNVQRIISEMGKGQHLKYKGDRTMTGNATRAKARSWQWRRGKDAGFKNSVLLLVKVAGIASLLFILFFFSLVLFLPLPEAVIPEATKIFDANGRLVSSLFEQNRVIVAASEMSPHLRKAIVASEDQRFFSHGGIDPQGLARALVRNIVPGNC